MSPGNGYLIKVPQRAIHLPELIQRNIEQPDMTGQKFAGQNFAMTGNDAADTWATSKDAYVLLLKTCFCGTAIITIPSGWLKCLRRLLLWCGCCWPLLLRCGRSSLKWTTGGSITTDIERCGMLRRTCLDCRWTAPSLLLRGGWTQQADRCRKESLKERTNRPCCRLDGRLKSFPHEHRQRLIISKKK